jgi:CelD/BcsL family acetyltransferase involved in cellulose biosynthesis
MEYALEIVTDAEVFARRREAWNALAERSGSPMLSHDWIMSCAESFAGGLHVLEVRRGGALAAAAPLAAVGSGMLRRLEFPGAAELYEPSSFLYEDAAALAALCGALAAQELPLLLHRVPSDEPVEAALQEATAGRGWWIRRDGGDCPYATTLQDWDGYLAARSSQRRYDLRRARRRLQEHGAVRFDCISPDEAELGGLLEAAFAVEAAGWKGRNGSSILQRSRVKDFLERYARRACQAGRLSLCFLRLDATPVAMELAVESGGRFWVLKIGYDERWSSCSPGLQLLTDCVRESVDRGCATHEFLGSAEPWIQPWADAVRRHETLRYYPGHWRGATTWIADQAGRARAFRKRGSGGGG